MSLKDSMTTLCNGIKRSEEQRAIELKRIQGGANRLISNFHRERMTMAKDLRAQLDKGRAELTEKTDTLLKEFRNKRTKLQKELAAAFDVWQKFTMRPAIAVT